jgi:glycosyltransferase involved in cell wall biosynthesis
MAARYDRIKDFDTLILCLVDFKKINPNFLCLLAGKDVTELNILLYNKVVDYGLVKNIKLLGLCEDMHKFYASLDVFVMSSLSEGFPNVIGEAMNFGIPCVSTNVGDSKLIIADCGWITPPKNQSKMTESLVFAHKMYLENKDEWVRLKSKCNRRISKNYSDTIMFGKYSNLWN